MTNVQIRRGSSTSCSLVFAGAKMTDIRGLLRTRLRVMLQWPRRGCCVLSRTAPASYSFGWPELASACEAQGGNWGSRGLNIYLLAAPLHDSANLWLSRCHKMRNASTNHGTNIELLTASSKSGIDIDEEYLWKERSRGEPFERWKCNRQ